MDTALNVLIYHPLPLAALLGLLVATGVLVRSLSAPIKPIRVTND